ncbi:hypothetical protein Nmel_008136 [Mimus melanotis]
MLSVLKDKNHKINHEGESMFLNIVLPLLAFRMALPLSVHLILAWRRLSDVTTLSPYYIIFYFCFSGKF